LVVAGEGSSDECGVEVKAPTSRRIWKPSKRLSGVNALDGLDNHFPFELGVRAGDSLFVLLWFSEWQGRDLRRACFQSLRRHIFNGLFTGEEFSDWSTTIVVMAAFDSGQLASLWSLTEVFGSMCLILEKRRRPEVW
jgi:hypothetical protein